jgi:hypothetical protein
VIVGRTASKAGPDRRPAPLQHGHGAVWRLRARIAAEAVFWEGASANALLEVVADVRASGDVETVLEVLSVAHNPLLAPEHTDLRLRLSEEMLVLAGRHAPRQILELMAVCWRAVDMFLAGDGRAERALADLRDRAEAFQSLSILYVLRVMEAMLLIRRVGSNKPSRSSRSGALEQVSGTHTGPPGSGHSSC